MPPKKNIATCGACAALPRRLCDGDAMVGTFCGPPLGHITWAGLIRREACSALQSRVAELRP
eukprot:178176-Pyramimonas_sp.AAC.1